MKGHMFTIYGIYLLNGIIQFIGKNGRSDVETLFINQKITAKSGIIKHKKRFTDLCRFAISLGLLEKKDKQYILTDLGKLYYNNMGKDIWVLTKNQKEILREYIEENPIRNPDIFSLTKLLELTNKGINGDELIEKFCLSIDREKEWKADITKKDFLKFRLHYLEELGYIQNTSEYKDFSKIVIPRKKAR